MKTPVATYGLCEGVERGSTFKIRKEFDTGPKFLEEKEAVEIADFCDKSRPPQCRNEKARLLKFKGDEDGQWHPMWIINCKRCPFYDPTWSWPGNEPGGYLTKGDRFWSEGNNN